MDSIASSIVFQMSHLKNEAYLQCHPCFLPTVTLMGMPIRSASLILLQGVSFLSSSKTSTPGTGASGIIALLDCSVPQPYIHDGYNYAVGATDIGQMIPFSS